MADEAKLSEWKRSSNQITKALAQHRRDVPEAENLTLYGLWKQWSSGDNEIEKPPEPQKEKAWAAWRGFQGMSREEAFTRYERKARQVLEGLGVDLGADAAVASGSPSTPSASSNTYSTPIMQPASASPDRRGSAAASPRSDAPRDSRLRRSGRSAAPSEASSTDGGFSRAAGAFGLSVASPRGSFSAAKSLPIGDGQHLPSSSSSSSSPATAGKEPRLVPDRGAADDSGTASGSTDPEMGHGAGSPSPSQSSHGQGHGGTGAGSGSGSGPGARPSFREWHATYRRRYLRPVSPPQQFLLKERDILSGFNPRFFVMRQQAAAGRSGGRKAGEASTESAAGKWEIAYYYDQKDQSTPRGVLQIVRGETAVVDLPPEFGKKERTKRPDSFFPFELRGLRNKGKKTKVRLVAPTQEDCSQWKLWVQAASALGNKEEQRAPTQVEKRLGRMLGNKEADRMVREHALSRYRQAFPGVAIKEEQGVEQGQGEGAEQGGEREEEVGAGVGVETQGKETAAETAAGAGAGAADGKSASAVDSESDPATATAAGAASAERDSNAAAAADYSRLLPVYPGPFALPADPAVARHSEDSIQQMLALAREQDGAPEGHWVSNGTDSGVTLSSSADGIPGAKGTGIVEYPQSAILQVLRDVQLRMALDPQMKGEEPVEEVAAADHVTIQHRTFNGTLVTADRDMVTMTTYRILSEGPDRGTLVIASTDAPPKWRDAIPPASGVSRASLKIGGWIVKPLPGPGAPRCRATYLVRMTPGGSVPQWVVGTVMAAQGKLVSSMTRTIQKLVLPNGVPRGPHGLLWNKTGANREAVERFEARSPPGTVHEAEEEAREQRARVDKEQGGPASGAGADMGGEHGDGVEKEGEAKGQTKRGAGSSGAAHDGAEELWSAVDAPQQPPAPTAPGMAKASGSGSAQGGQSADSAVGTSGGSGSKAAPAGGSGAVLGAGTYAVGGASVAPLRREGPESYPTGEGHGQQSTGGSGGDEKPLGPSSMAMLGVSLAAGVIFLALVLVSGVARVPGELLAGALDGGTAMGALHGAADESIEPVVPSTAAPWLAALVGLAPALGPSGWMEALVVLSVGVMLVREAGRIMGPEMAKAAKGKKRAGTSSSSSAGAAAGGAASLVVGRGVSLASPLVASGVCQADVAFLQAASALRGALVTPPVGLGGAGTSLLSAPAPVVLQVELEVGPAIQAARQMNTGTRAGDGTAGAHAPHASLAVLVARAVAAGLKAAPGLCAAPAADAPWGPLVAVHDPAVGLVTCPRAGEEARGIRGSGRPPVEALPLGDCGLGNSGLPWEAGSGPALLSALSAQAETQGWGTVEGRMRALVPEGAEGVLRRGLEKGMGAQGAAVEARGAVGEQLRKKGGKGGAFVRLGLGSAAVVDARSSGVTSAAEGSDGLCAAWLEGMVPLVAVLGAPRRVRGPGGAPTDQVVAPVTVRVDGRLGVAWAAQGHRFVSAVRAALVRPPRE